MNDLFGNSGESPRNVGLCQMGYEIDISQVTEAEYPLIAVMRESIHRECGQPADTDVADYLAERSDILALIAHLEGNPVGFMVGHGAERQTYHVWAAGVLPHYRHRGLATRMLQQQRQFARSQGYRQLTFNPSMPFKHSTQLLAGADADPIP